MAANLPGDSQTIEPYAIRIFQGLKPDVVAIQEFKYQGNSSTELRAFVDEAFGPEFQYFREPFPSYAIPNGIISRYPIISSGTWDDPLAPDRGFAWARIDLPGTNDLYIVSVHLLYSGDRTAEATALNSQIQANFPAGAWIIVAGDFNTSGGRDEVCVTTFDSFLSDSPIPTDAESGGKPQTNNGRTEEYDYILVSHSMTNRMTNTVCASRSFPRGLVFDSRVYTPLSDVAPVLYADSGNGQHMGVLKDFLVPAGTNASAPAIVTQPQSLTNGVGSSATFSASASGAAPLTYIWRFNGSPVTSGTSTSFTISSVQTSSAGSYTVVVTNSAGSATSAVATLTVTLPVPYIIEQPQSQTAAAGSAVTFKVNAGGGLPLSYQWRSNSVDIAGATLTNHTILNAQAPAQANYTVVVTNAYGSITSAAAMLTIVAPGGGGATGVLAGWNMLGQTNYGASPMAPTTNMAGLNIGGLTRGTGIKTVATASGNSWGGNEAATTSSYLAIEAGDFATCSITANAGNRISFTRINAFAYKRSDTGAQTGLLQYQIGAGAFADIVPLSFPSTTAVSLAPVDLSAIASLQNVAPQTTVTFRLVLYSATGTGGNWYFTDSDGGAAPEFAFFGTVTPIVVVPAIAPVFSNVMKAGDSFQFQVTGTPTSNYVVEASASLGAAWIPVFTNPAPFVFADTNADTTARRFFRGKVAP
jgi:endonuclease/exonuclease/phosphatase family metal-dependent hydrolase